MSTANAIVVEDPPLVSVVMPVHNGERFLDESIYSIRNQTLQQLELIVVDDGSTDVSYTIAMRHAAEDIRVRVIQLEHRGLAVALNTGMEAARAPWIARMDADDVALPERLERQMQVLSEQPDIAVLGTHGWIVGTTGRVVGRSRLGPSSREEFARLRSANEAIYLLHPSVVFARDVVLALGGYRQEYFPAEDVDLWSRVADQHIVLTLAEPLVRYRVHSSAVSLSRFNEQVQAARHVVANTTQRRAGQPELSRAAFRALEQQKPLWRWIRQRLAQRSQYYYRYGGSLIANGNSAGLIWLAISALLYPPFPLGRLKRQAVFLVTMSQFRNWLFRSCGCAQAIAFKHDNLGGRLARFPSRQWLVYSVLSGFKSLGRY